MKKLFTIILLVLIAFSGYSQLSVSENTTYKGVSLTECNYEVNTISINLNDSTVTLSVIVKSKDLVLQIKSYDLIYDEKKTIATYINDVYTAIINENEYINYNIKTEKR